MVLNDEKEVARGEAEVWRNGLWGRYASYSVSAEPARGLLPGGEDRWRPTTWRHFRFVLIRHLQNEGAHTLTELAEDPPRVLGLGLNRKELRATIDSARRRGEVEALPRSAQVATREVEWTATDRGSQATSHSLSWLSSQGNRLRGWMAPVASGLGVFGIGATAPNGPSLHTLILISVMVGVAVWLLVSIRTATSGAKAGRQVERDWDRWRQERPGWYRRVFRPFPWKTAMVGTVALLGGSWVWVGWNPRAGLAALALSFACYIRLIIWHERWQLPDA